MFRNVIVGVDGKEGGLDAIALAESLRDDAGQLTLAYVYAQSRTSGAWRVRATR